MATHSSILAWRIPWTEAPGRLQSMGSHRIGHNWRDLAHKDEWLLMLGHKNNFTNFHFALLDHSLSVKPDAILWEYTSQKNTSQPLLTSKCCVLYLVAQLCLTLWDCMDCRSPGSSVHGDSSGKNTGVGCHFLLQGIFPTQGSNPGFLHCRQTLYNLSH